ncbi:MULTISPECIES: type II toxin-antitoxin system antitoxin SocA domain-containing protein, partial [unclassified Granulicatella]|uniref:type II toxin-antitoxin system antitoxin SocA domain-containing protein n=1 Tax=unclassified Granulicatella TaxID=2630493 RepID=UPI001073EA76
PVVEEMYRQFKEFGSSSIKMEDDETYVLEDIALPQAIGRMMLVQYSEDVIHTLFYVVKQYGNLTGKELIEYTHSKNGPWDTVYREGLNCEITDAVIISQAKYERY